MKLQLLIAIGHQDYMEHLSDVLTQRYGETFEVSVCSTGERLRELLSRRRFDAALLDETLAEEADLSAVRLPLLLWDGAAALGPRGAEMEKLRKYQRISTMTGQVLERYAAVCDSPAGFETGRGRITAVWSPAGGCGKTTVALAYAAQLVSRGKKTVYLDLEPFSSTPVYFADPERGLTDVFEKLDGNLKLLFQSIRREDSGSGILYFGRPDNYDDIEILTPDDVTALLQGASAGVEELVVDLGSSCDRKTRRILELAAQVLLVTDGTQASRVKCGQFRAQHDLYALLADRLTVVANRGARGTAQAGERTVSLPLVQSDDPVVVYKTLSAGYFQD